MLHLRTIIYQLTISVLRTSNATAICSLKCKSGQAQTYEYKFQAFQLGLIWGVITNWLFGLKIVTFLYITIRLTDKDHDTWGWNLAESRKITCVLLLKISHDDLCYLAIKNTVNLVCMNTPLVAIRSMGSLGNAIFM